LGLNREGYAYDRLNDWLASPAGHGVVAAIDEKLKPILNQLRGENLLQIGIDRQFWHYNLFRFQHIHVLSPSTKTSFATFTSELEAVPLANESVDCIIAPFALELAIDGEQLISELDRILNPMGYLILIGVNPWGLWGMFSKLKKKSSFEPSKGSLRSAFSVRKCLQRKGYNIQLVDSFYYMPQLNSVTGQAKLGFLNEVGKMLWPIPGGFYFMLAQKFQLNLLDVEPEPIPMIPQDATFRFR